MNSSLRAFGPWFAAFILTNSGFTSSAADAAADSLNATGLALHGQSTGKGGNALLSPWSIQNSMAMVFAGAGGETKKEMEAALHLGDAIHPAFKSLNAALTQELPKGAELRTANRLFTAESCKLLPDFLQTVTQNYGSSVESLGFTAPDKAAARINAWVTEQTNRKINDLIPAGSLTTETRLVVTNAVYFNVPWQVRFTKELTKDQPFLISTGTQKNVPLMFKQTQMRYAKKNGFQMAALPYAGGQLQFTVIVPDKVDGLTTVEKALTPALLAECATMPKSEVRLSLPRFRMEPPSVELKSALAAIGMKSAFSSNADFSRMTGEDLYIANVFHRTFIDVNEDGTEAAAATAAEFRPKNGHPHEVPHKTVRADRPFAFAIQHVASGACLFLGRLADPNPATPAVKTATSKPALKK